MKSHILRTMNKFNMMPKVSVLVGLSGGADSVALTHVLYSLSREYGFLVYTAHINHNLRGEDALRDEQFAKEFSKKLGVECFVLNADVRAVARNENISEELAGRKIRYEFFEKIMREKAIECTATAHHKNDNAETIIMNFMRGSSLSGLSGIPYKRGRFIRPLLDVTREEIEQYCADNALEYVTDSTNNENIYTRNKIRNLLIPQIEGNFNPNIVNTITANAQIISYENDYLESVTENEFARIFDGNSIDINELISLHKAVGLRIIRRFIDNICTIDNIPASVIVQIYNIAVNNVTGTCVNVAADFVARVQYGRLIIEKNPEVCPHFSYSIKIGDKKEIPELSCIIETEFVNEVKKDACEYFAVPPEISEITVKNREKGDTFIPTGMKGHKRIKDYMVNEKIPKYERDKIGLVEFDGKIGWVMGYRRDERFMLRNKNSDSRLLKIHVTYCN